MNTCIKRVVAPHRTDYYYGGEHTKTEWTLGLPRGRQLVIWRAGGWILHYYGRRLEVHYDARPQKKEWES